MSFHETSMGHSFSTNEWLDLHFDMAQPEYAKIVHLAGFKQGWHVLDAGCGNGRFPDILSQYIGTTGEITAVDLAYENMMVVAEKRPVKNNAVADVTGLPFVDNAFDAVWCSAVTQYLTEEQLLKALHEFHRVVKPGGKIAIKEYDGSSAFVYPLPELSLLWRSTDYMDVYDKGRWIIHPLMMPRLLRNAGMQDVTQQTVLVERRHPLQPIDREYVAEAIRTGQISWAQMDNLPSCDRKLWEEVLSETSERYLPNNPDFYWREGHILTTGFVGK